MHAAACRSLSDFFSPQVAFRVVFTPLACRPTRLFLTVASLLSRSCNQLSSICWRKVSCVQKAPTRHRSKKKQCFLSPSTEIMSARKKSDFSSLSISLSTFVVHTLRHIWDVGQISYFLWNSCGHVKFTWSKQGSPVWNKWFIYIYNWDPTEVFPTRALGFYKLTKEFS